MGILSIEIRAGFVWMPFRKMWNCLIAFQAARHVSTKNSCGPDSFRFPCGEPGARDVYTETHYDANPEVENWKTSNKPEGNITFFFHYWPESIWLKIKPAGLLSLIALHSQMTTQAKCHIKRDLHYPALRLFMWKSSCCLPNRGACPLLFGRSVSSCQLIHGGQNNTTLTGG